MKWLVRFEKTPKNIGVMQDEWMLHAIAGCCVYQFELDKSGTELKCRCGDMKIQLKDVGEWGASFKLFLDEKPYYLTDWLHSWTGIPFDELEVGIDYGTASE